MFESFIHQNLKWAASSRALFTPHGQIAQPITLYISLSCSHWELCCLNYINIHHRYTRHIENTAQYHPAICIHCTHSACMVLITYTHLYVVSFSSTEMVAPSDSSLAGTTQSSKAPLLNCTMSALAPISESRTKRSGIISNGLLAKIEYSVLYIRSTHRSFRNT